MTDEFFTDSETSRIVYRSGAVRTRMTTDPPATDPDKVVIFFDNLAAGA